MVDIDDITALSTRIGEEIAVSDWFDVTQERVTRFADATDDHQWIHVDPERAATQSPFGTTIAHGFLTLSLVSTLARNAMSFSRVRMVINYGVNRVRFVSPVPVGSRIRGRFSPAALETTGRDVKVIWHVVVEREGADKPCAVAEWILRYYGTG